MTFWQTSYSIYSIILIARIGMQFMCLEMARRKSSTDHLDDPIEEESMEVEEEEEEEGGWKEVREHSKKKEKPKVINYYMWVEIFTTDFVNGLG